MLRIVDDQLGNLSIQNDEDFATIGGRPGGAACPSTMPQHLPARLPQCCSFSGGHMGPMACHIKSQDKIFDICHPHADGELQ